ncbi:MAG: acyltransferase family protein [bacterium]
MSKFRISLQNAVVVGIIVLAIIVDRWWLLVACLIGLYWTNPRTFSPASASVERAGTLAAYAHGRDNNFNLIRMLAAWAVLYSHSYPLTSTRPDNWFAAIHPGTYAVYIFFAISGFLVAKSFDRKQDLRAFVNARLFRIIPALLVVSALSAVLLGWFLTTLDTRTYFSESQTWEYIYNNALLIHTEYKLPGVFADNPLPNAVNGSLWTLRFEMRMYMIIALAGVLGVLIAGPRRWIFSLLFWSWYLAIQFQPEWLEDTRKARLFGVVALYFYLGAMAYHYRDHLYLNIWTVLIALMIGYAGWYGPLPELAIAIALIYTVFYLAMIPGGWLRHYNRIGDYSYGFYLWAFPVQQTLVFYQPDISAAEMTVLASAITLLFAIASWYVVEKPALQLNARIGKSGNNQ